MKWLRLLAVLSVLSGAAWLFRTSILNECFDLLVSAESPSKADMAVVLAGDGSGNRLLRAAQMDKDGFVPAVLVSGPDGIYNTPECDLAIPFAVSHGYPESYFRHLHGSYLNTADEAVAVIAELRKMHATKVLVVTSGHHSRRASRYYRHIPGIEAHMIASPDRYADRDIWWRSREGRKTIFMEWSKTIATWLGL